MYGVRGTIENVIFFFLNPGPSAVLRCSVYLLYTTTSTAAAPA